MGNTDKQQREYDSKDKPKGRHNGVWIFLLTMIISFCILGSGFLLLLYYTRTNGVVNEKSDVPYVSEYHPRQDENMTLLVLGCKTPESSPDMMALFRYDAPKGTITCVLLPPSLICKTKSNRQDTLRGQYDYAGIGGCVDALESFLDIDIPHYARIQQLGLSNMVDFFGGVDYNLLAPREIDGELLMDGEQLLDGRRFSALCLSNLSETVPTPDIKLQAELTSLLLNNSLTTFSPTRYSSLSTSLFYNSETNITQYDFALRQEGFLGSIKSSKLEKSVYFLKGLYSSDYEEFYPNAQSLEEAKEAVTE